MSQLKITWTKSYIGKTESQRKVIHSLGLKRLNHTVVHSDTPTIRGMVNKVNHLVTVEEVAEGQ
jgi:large subunit ribosomal protein L30